MLDEYIHYPLPSNAWIPYNYCALPRLLGEDKDGLVTKLLSPFC